MEVVAWKGLPNIQELWLVCRCIIPSCVRASCIYLALQSSVSGDARLKVVDWKVLSNIQEFIINPIPTYLHPLHVAVALSCLQFVFALRNW